MKLLLTLVLNLLIITLWAVQAKDKISPELLLAFETNEIQECLVILNDQKVVRWEKGVYIDKETKSNRVYNELKSHAKSTQKLLKQIVLENNGTYRSHFLVNALYVKGNKALILELARKNQVKKIVHLATIVVDSQGDQNLDLLEIVNTWGIDTIQAPAVWDMGYRGEGAIIGNQDTGVDWVHEGIQPSYRGTINDSTFNHSYAWHDAIHYPEDTTGVRINPCGYDLRVPCDDHGHGTHTLGTSVGKFEEFCFGVAPAAKWMACRNMDRGRGTPETYIECFEWFLAPTDSSGNNPNPSLAPDVINNSWGCPPNEGCNPSNFDFMSGVIRNLKSAGILVVVSAGNSGRQGCGSISSPAAIFEPSFVVGSIDQRDTLSSFSSIGPILADSSFRLKPNVVAPGRNVRSSSPNNSFRNSSGTSMAGPHVAGLVALMVSANPLLKGQVDTIESMIEITSSRRYLSGRDCYNYTGLEDNNHIYGHGRINALAAVEMALKFDTTIIINNVDVDNIDAVRVFPNPVGKELQLAYDNSWLGSNVTIYDRVGRKLIRTTLRKRIDVSGLKKGIYFIEIKSTEKKKTMKLFKS